MSWTEERVELLRKLWNDGLSASQVAAELGAGITRNAVIGKIHRLGLAERAKTTAAPRLRPQKPAPRSAAPTGASGGASTLRAAGGNHVATPGGPVVMGNVALAFSPVARPAATPMTRPEEEVVVPISERVTLMELRESMCRWPMGDPTNPEFRFCGAHAPIGGGPYCAHHSRVAYQPAQERRRLRETAKITRQL
jgi:GcrA cell cycle regulator